jgi:hypothetical protein
MKWTWNIQNWLLVFSGVAFFRRRKSTSFKKPARLRFMPLEKRLVFDAALATAGNLLQLNIDTNNVNTSNQTGLDLSYIDTDSDTIPDTIAINLTNAGDIADPGLDGFDPGSQMSLDGGVLYIKESYLQTFSDGFQINGTQINLGISGDYSQGSSDLQISADSMSFTQVDLSADHIALQAVNGGITQDADSVFTTNSLQVQSAGDVNMAGHNTVSLLAAYSSGDFIFNHEGALTVGSIGSVTGVTVDGSSNLKQLTIVTHSPLNIDAEIVNHSGGNILLAAEGNADADDVTINAYIHTEGGDGTIDIYAGDDINVISGAITTGTSHNHMFAGTNYNSGAITAGNAQGDVNFSALTFMGTNSGSLRIDATGHILLSFVSADNDNNNTFGDVTLNAGDNIDVQSYEGDGTGADIVANNLYVTAGSGILFDTKVNTISGDVTGTGDIEFTEFDGITLTSLQTSDGSISVNAFGDVAADYLDSSNMDDDTNDITIISSNEIVVGLINAGTMNDVDLTAGGVIYSSSYQGDTNGADIIADNLTFMAGGYVQLDTDVNAVNGSTTAAGAIQLAEKDSIELTSLETNDGSITVKAGDKITAINIDTLATDNDTNDIVLEAGGDIEVGLINAGTMNDVELTATSGSVYATTFDDDGNGADVIADDLQVSAGGDVSLDTDVSTMTGAVIALGNIAIHDKDAITLTSLVANDGSITVYAGGEITATSIDTSGTGNGSNDIALYAVGNLAVGSINAGLQNDVRLQATGTVDADSVQNDYSGADVTANELVIVAGTGTTLDTNVTLYSASLSSAGDIQIANSKAVELVSVTTTDGTITVKADGQIDATSVDTSAADNDSNDIVLTSTSGIVVGSINAGSMNDVSLSAAGAVTAASFQNDGTGTDLTADHLQVTAGGGVTLDTAIATVNAVVTGAGDIQLANSGQIDLTSLTTADGAISVKATGNITATSIDTSTNDDGDNDITLDADGDIKVISIQAGTQNDVVLKSTASVYSDTFEDDYTGADVVADDLQVTAGTSITLDTDVNSITAETTGTGSVQITDKDNVILTSIITNAGSITVKADGKITAVSVDSSTTDDDNNDITLTSTDDIEVGLIQSGALNDVFLTAVGSISATAFTNDGAGADVVADDLQMTAGSGITLDTSVTTVTGELTNAGNIQLSDTDQIELTSLITADGSITVKAQGDITATSVDSSATDDNTNNISLDAVGDIHVGLVKAGISNDVILKATGKIISASFEDDGTGADVIADDLQVTAGTGITLDIDVATVTGEVTGLGNIQVAEKDAITLTSLKTNAGSIAAKSLDNMTATSVDSSTTDDGTNDITLVTTGDMTVGLINAGAQNDVSLTASGKIDAVSFQNDGTGADIIADNLQVTAGTGITLDTEVASVTGEVTGTGNIQLAEKNAITLTSVKSNNGTITVKADGNLTATSVDSSTTDNGSNDITLTTTGDMIVGLIEAGAQNDVSLTATGKIDASSFQNDGTGADVIANDLQVTAGTSITLDTDIATVTGEVTGSGNIQLAEKDAITLTSLITNDGSITVKSLGNMTATSVDSSNTDDGSNDITLTTGGDLVVGLVKAGTQNDVFLTATGKVDVSSFENDGTGADVIADDLQVIAGTSITLDTDVASMTGETTGAGNIQLAEKDAIALTSLKTNAGSITAKSLGNMTASSVDSSNTNNGSNDITLMTSGDLIVGLVKAGTQNDVSLTATGKVEAVSFDDDGTGADVIANDLQVTAGTGITLDTDVATVSGEVTGTGDIQLAEKDGITLTSLLTSIGSIFVKAWGNLTATSVDTSATNDGTQEISLTTTGDMLVGLVNAGSQNDVSLTATGSVGAVTFNDDYTGADVIADNLQVTAGTTITLDTDVESITAESTGVGDIKLTEADDLKLDSVITADGAIIVKADGNLTANSVDSSATDDDTNDITLVTTGDMTVGLINAGAQNDVSLTATGIIESSSLEFDGTGADVIADHLQFTAGSSVTLDTEVASVTGEVTGLGDVMLAEADDITIDSLVTANGAVVAVAFGDMAVTSVDVSATDDGNNFAMLAAFGNMTVGSVVAGTLNSANLQAGGSITATTFNDDGTGADVIANELIIVAGTGIQLDTDVALISGGTDDTGDIEIHEKDALTLDLLVATDGSIKVTAGGDLIATSVDTATTDDGTNDITLVSTGDLTIGLVEAGALNNVFLTATGKVESVVFDNDGFDPDVIANNLQVTAGTGITLDTEVTSITGEVIGTGGIQLYEYDDIALTSLVTADGNIDVTADGDLTATLVESSATDDDSNDINLEAGGDMTIGSVVAGTQNDVTLTATGSILSATFNNDGTGADITADDLQLSAGAGITLDTDVASITGEVTGTGNIQLAEKDAITLTSLITNDGSITVKSLGNMTATSVDSSNTDDDSNDITLTTGGDLVVGLVKAGTQNDVSLTATGKVDVVSFEDDGTGADVIANDLQVTAGTGVTLDTDVASITGEITSTGNMQLAEKDAITLTSLITSFGSIIAKAWGNMTATSVDTSATDDDTNDITLVTTGDMTVGLINAGTMNDVSLTATGFVSAASFENDYTGADIIADNMQVTAGTGITLDIEVASVTGEVTGIGNIQLAEKNAITLTSVKTNNGTITVKADGNLTATSVDSSTTDNGSNDITLTTTGDMIVGLINAGTLNDVSLTATGNVDATSFEHDGTGADVIADNLQVTAGTGITLDTDVATITGESTGTGNIQLAEKDAITLTSLITNDGSITAKSLGNMTATSVDSSTTDDGTNDITLDVTGNLIIGLVKAGALNDASLTATGKVEAVSFEDDGTGADVIANDLQVTAGTGITLDTDVASITGEVTGTGAIQLAEKDAIDLVSLITNNGAITAKSWGNMTATSVDSSATDNGSNDITLVTTNDMTIGLIKAGTQNDVSLTATGFVNSGTFNNDYTGADVIADDLQVSAGTGIALDTDVNSITAEVTSVNKIELAEKDAITLTSLITNDGSITVKADGQVTAVSVDSSNTDNGSNDISITSTSGIEVGLINAGAQNNVILDAAGSIAATIFDDDGTGADVIANDLQLTAGTGITLDTDVVSITGEVTGTGDIQLAEKDGITLTSLLTSIGSIFVKAWGNLTATSVDTSATNDGTQEISLTTTGDMLVGLVNAGSQNDVSLTATGSVGAVTFNDDYTGADVIADNLQVTAGTTITLDTDVESITAESTGVGDIKLTEADDLKLDSVITADGAIIVKADGNLTANSVDSSNTDDDTNDITLLTTGDMTVGLINAGAQNDVSLTASGFVSAASFENDYTGADIIADNLQVTAGTGITLDTEVATLTGEVTGTGNIQFAEKNAITLTSVKTNNGTITVKADGNMTATSVDSSATDNGSNDITLTTTGDMIVGLIKAGVQNDVSLTATGKIDASSFQNDGTGADVIADDLQMTAGIGITLDTEIATVTGEVTGSGNIQLAEKDAITLTSLKTNNGTITAKSLGNMTATSVDSSTTDNGTNDVTLTTGGDLFVGLIKAGIQNDVSLTATGKVEASSFDNDGTGADVIADELQVTAGTGITLDTEVASITGEVTGAGNIQLNELDDIDLTSLITADGRIDVIAGGNMTATLVDSSATDDDSNDIDLEAGGDMTIGSVVAGTQNDVTLTATGSILSATFNNDGTGADITADDLQLSAGTGIEIDTDVATVTGEVTGTGDLKISEKDSITLTSLTTAAGAIAVNALGNITATSVDSSATDDGTHDINLASGGTLTVGLINAGAQNNVSLTATNAVTASSFENDGTGADVIANNLQVTAGTSITLDTDVSSITAESTGTGAIQLAEKDDVLLTSVKTADGAITVKAYDDLTATLVDSSTTDDDTNDITLMTTADLFVGLVKAGTQNDISLSAGGKIEAVSVENDGTGADVVADDLQFTTVNGIVLDTDVNTVTGSVTGTGDILLVEKDAITLTSLTTADGRIVVGALGTITATAVDTSATDNDVNDVQLISAGDIIIGSINAGTLNDIQLMALGVITSSTFNNDGTGADITADNLQLTAGTGVQVDTDVASVSGSVTGIGDIEISEKDAVTLTSLTTADGSIAVNALGSITATSVDSSATDDGTNDISLTSGGTINVGLVNAGAVNDVNLTATGAVAAITFDNDGTGADVVANNLQVTAGTSITLDTNVATITAESTGTGAIQLAEANAVTLTSVKTATGTITVKAFGNLTATSVDSSTTDNGSNDITLSTTGDMAVGLVKAGAQNDASLTATGKIDATSFQDDGTGADVIADDLQMTAGTGIRLDTDIATVTGEVTGIGNIQLAEKDAITLSSLKTNNGTITAKSFGNMTATLVDSSTTDNGTNDVTLTTGGDLLVGLINAGTQNDVSLTATGMIDAVSFQNDGTGADVIADDLQMTAGTGIRLDTDIATVTGEVTGTGSIQLAEKDAITLTSLKTNNGAITARSLGNMTATSVDSSTTDNDANDVTLTTGGDLFVGLIKAGIQNDVSLTATGKIDAVSFQDDGTGADVIADDLQMTAGTGITLDSDIATVTGEVTGIGNIQLAEKDAITLTSLKTNNGSITARSLGNMTATLVDSSTTDNGTNDVTLTTGGDLLIGLINAGVQNDAILTATGKIDAVSFQDDGTGADVIADDLQMTAGTGIRLDTDIATVTGEVTGVGNIQLAEKNAITLTSLKSNNGTITAKSLGNMTATSVDSSTTDNGVNDVTLTTGGDLLIGLINAGAQNDAVLTATGKIDAVSFQDDGTGADVIADDLQMTAGTGIRLDTDIATVTGEVTGVGNIQLAENNAITLTSLKTNNGTITARSLGNMTATSVDSSTTDNGTNDVTLTTGGDLFVGLIKAGTQNDVSLTATGKIDAVSFQDDGTGADVIADDLQMTAGTGIRLDTDIASVTGEVTGTGNIQITEKDAITITSLKTANGSITAKSLGAMTIGSIESSTNNGNNDIVLSTVGDMFVDLIDAGSMNDVSLTATGKIEAIVFNDDGTGADVIANDLQLSAGTGIQLDTDVTSVTGQVTGTGNIQVAEKNAITLTSLVTSMGSIIAKAWGNMTATSVDSSATDNDANDITLITTGDMIVGLVKAGVQNDVTLTATGSVNAASFQNDSTGADVIADNLTITAGGTAMSATPSTGIVLDIDVNTITAEVTGAGNVQLAEKDAITLTSVITNNGFVTVKSAGNMTATSVNTSTTDNGANDVTLTTGGDLLVGLINAGTQNDVALTATGKIDAVSFQNDGTGVDVITDDLQMTAGTGIRLDTDIATVTGEVTGTGNIQLAEKDAITLTSLKTNNGAITAKSLGNMTATSVDSSTTDNGTNDVTLTTGGDLLVGLIKAGTQNDAVLTATGKIDAVSFQNDGTGADVIADDLQMTAGTGITLDTEIATVTGEVTGTGNIQLAEKNAITLTSLKTNNGTITAKSLGNMTATSVDSSTTDNGANDVTLTTGGDLLVGLINAGVQNDVSLTATGKIDAVSFQNDGTGADVIADDLQMTTGTGITLDTEIATVTGEVTGTGNIQLAEKYVITLTSLKTNNGTITARSLGNMTATLVDSSTTDNGTNDVTLTTGGDLFVGLIKAGIQNDVSLTATGKIDAVSFQNDGTGADVIADDLQMTAGTGIRLDTDIATVTGEVTGIGNIQLAEKNVITLTSLKTNNGTITARSLGNMTATLVDSSTTDNGTNDVTLTTGGDLLVGLIKAGAQNDVSLTAAGKIDAVSFQNDGTGADVIADDLQMTAGTGIRLDTDIATVTGEVTGTGSIQLAEKDAITLTSLKSNNGAITAKSLGNMTATSVDSSTTDNGVNDVTLSTGGDLLVGLINAGAQNDAVLTATGKIDAVSFQDDGTGADVIADDLQMTAGTGIRLDTDIATVTGEVTGIGNIQLAEKDAITLTSLKTNNGTITAKSLGNMTATLVDSSTMDNGTNDVTLTTGGDLLVGLINAGVQNDVSLTATGKIDAVSFQNDGTGADVIADDLQMTAGTGITLDTDIATVTGEVTGTGSIQLAEKDAITLTSLKTNNGSITAKSLGNMTATLVDSSTTDNGVNDVTLSTGGDLLVGLIKAGAQNDVSLTATGKIDAVSFQNDFTGADVIADDLQMTAGTGITLDTEVATITGEVTGSGNIQLAEKNAVTLTSLKTGNGSITTKAGGNLTATLVDSSTTDNGVNDVNLSTTGDMLIGLINAGTQNDAVLTATGKIEAIVFNDNGTGADIIADDLQMTAGTGIKVDTDVATVTGEVTGTGNIQLAEKNAVTLTSLKTNNGTITAKSWGNMTATSVDSSTTDNGNNDITLITTGDMNVGLVNAGVQNDAVLTATGKIEAVSFQNDGTGADVIADDLQITSGTGIKLDTDIATVTGEVTGIGNLQLTEKNAVTLTSLKTNNGSITAKSYGNMTATSVDSSTTDNGTNDVTLTTTGDLLVGLVKAGTQNDAVFTAGGKIDAVSFQNDGTGEDVIADDLQMTAGTGIRLDTDVATITGEVTGTGNIQLSEKNAVTLTSLKSNNGPITVKSGGTMTATLVDSSTTDNNANDVTLSATGNILVGLIKAGTQNDVTLTASGNVTAVTFNNNGTGADVVADNLQVTTGTGIQLDTDVATITGQVNGTGSIQLSEKSSVTLTSLKTNNGSVTANALGSITATSIDTATTDNGVNDVDLTAGIDILVGLIKAGAQNDVRLTANDDVLAVSYQGDGTGVDVIARDLQIIAHNQNADGTTAVQLDTQITNLVAAVDGVNRGDLIIHEADSIALATSSTPNDSQQISTTNGKIRIVAENDITVVDGGVMNEGSSLTADPEIVSGGAQFGGIDLRAMNITFGDNVQIQADNSQDAAVFVRAQQNVQTGLNFQIRTGNDIGVARQFVLRPGDGLPGDITALFQMMTITTENLNGFLASGNGGNYRGQFTFTIGVDGERGLQIHINWDDAVSEPGSVSSEGPRFGVQSQNGNQMAGLDGASSVTIEHTYTNADILAQSFANAQKGNPGALLEFNVTFSVSQHPSIVVLADTVNGVSIPKGPGADLGVATSSDIPTSPGTIGLINSSGTETVGPFYPGPDQGGGVGAALQNGTVQFVAQVSVYAPPVIIEKEPIDQPVFMSAQFTDTRVVNSVVTNEFESVSQTSARGRELYFQLRILSPDPNEEDLTEPVRLPEDIFSGDNIRQFFSQMPDGTYEIELVRGAENIRTIVKFEVRQGELVVPGESLDDGFFELQEMKPEQFLPEVLPSQPAQPTIVQPKK